MSAPGDEWPVVDYTRLYQQRFPKDDHAFRVAAWTILVDGYLSRWIAPTDHVLDLGAGDCEFSNAIRAARVVAVDLSTRTAEAAADRVEVHVCSADEIRRRIDGSFDVVFSSNFFEHLSGPDQLVSVLQGCYEMLKPGGRLIAIVPNIRFTGPRFWDFLDHTLPLTHESFVEALTLADFGADVVIPRFLPYSVKRVRIRSPLLLRLYLRIPVLWRIAGAQMFIVASRPASDASAGASMA